jgi:hypothetical protein
LGALLGNFVFSHCGGVPSPAAIDINATSDWWQELIPLNSGFDHNSVTETQSAKGLSLAVGNAFSGRYAPGAISTFDALDATPTSYDLVFPQQFFGSFGLLVPPPFSETWAGQPFFYQDRDRVYFVTDTVPWYFSYVSGATTADPFHSSAKLTPGAQLGNAGLVFPKTATASRGRVFGAGGASSTTTATAGSVLPFGDITKEKSNSVSQVLFSTFFHPHVCAFIKAINRYGLAGFLTLANQTLTNDNGVISGFVLSPNPSKFTPKLSPGLLTAQGQLYEATTVPDPDLGPAPRGISYLYFNSQTKFYYSPKSAPNYPGDAYLGTVTALGFGVFETTGSTVFETAYQPNYSYIVADTYPRENVDFTATGAYANYNWELFFQIPLLIATSLSQNQKFQDAQKWFHYIFNPTINSADPVPQRYWTCLPFYECAPWDYIQGQIQNLMTSTSGAPAAQPNLCGQGIADQIQAWASDPFNPFLIGRMRTVAFRMKVVMAYLDNLIAWGDNLFGQNTRESINEATQIYVLAKEILGPRPTQIPARGAAQDYTYNDLVTLYGLNDFSNAMVQMENDFPNLTATTASTSPSLGTVISMSTVVPYFCYPPNDILLGYWNTVDDRLYKIRHCMNIQGVVEQVPLFSPPISPALLVAAAAEGVDLSSVLSNINSGASFYRFSFMMQKALELCAEVRSFGAALLAALEKQDGEALQLLRATQESSLLQATQQMKTDAINEAQATWDGLNASLAVATDRQNYYTALTTSKSRIPSELDQVNQLNKQKDQQDKSGTASEVANVLNAIPNFSFKVYAPDGGYTLGGQNLGSAASAVATQFSMNAARDGSSASMASLQGQRARRDDEWAFQLKSVTDEIIQINAQIKAAKFHVAIAQDDQSNLNLQIQNAQAVHEFLRGKYTNTELYSWMVGEASTVHSRCYQMAYDLATRVEAGFRFERGLTTSSYIQFGYWDSLKKGLMAGERLYADLKRMELAYLQTDVREYEITKPISLVLFDPFALIAFKTTGQCIVSLPEAFFDQDYPGHYFRRIKTVSLTIPCVTGPYTSVNCTLTLLNSKIRVDSIASSKTDFASDAHFITDSAATQSIATSTAQNDPGLFEVNFRDERYLPLEGKGAILVCQIDLPIDCNAFDFDSITDVVINLRYTSRYGGDRLRDLARQAASLPARPVQTFTGSTTQFAKPQTPVLQRMFSLRHEFPTEWYKFLNPPDTATSQSMSIALGNDRFPFQYRGAAITITQIELVLLCASPKLQAAYAKGGPLVLQLGPPIANAQTASVPLTSGGILGGAPYGSFNKPPPPKPASSGGPPSWTLQASGAAMQNMGNASFVNSISIGGTTYNHLIPGAIGDILLLCQFTAS